MINLKETAIYIGWLCEPHGNHTHTRSHTHTQKFIENIKKKMKKKSQYYTKESQPQEKREREGLEKQLQNNEQNGNNYNLINNYLKFKWSKFTNQKI